MGVCRELMSPECPPGAGRTLLLKDLAANESVLSNGMNAGRCLEDPASPRRSGCLSGLAERPRVSLSLNKGGFKKQKPSGLVLSKP